MLWEHASLIYECNDYKKALQMYAQILQVTLKLRNKVVVNLHYIIHIIVHSHIKTLSHKIPST